MEKKRTAKTTQSHAEKAQGEFVFEAELTAQFIKTCRDKKQNPNAVLSAYMRYYTRQFDLFD